MLNHGELVPTGHGSATHLTITTELDEDDEDDERDGQDATAERDNTADHGTDNDDGGDRAGDTDDGDSADSDGTWDRDGDAADGDAAGDSAAGGAVGENPGGRGRHGGCGTDPAGGVIGRLGRGELSWGGALSAAAVRRIACDAGIRWIITNTHEVPLYVGREHRTATPGQWAALTTRDGGCVFPGCTRPVEWTEAHHVVWWRNNGGTNIDNLCLLCSAHHRSVHHHGWDIQFGSDNLPEFLPPTWIDPNRTPRRNNRPRYYKNNTPGP